MKEDAGLVSTGVLFWVGDRRWLVADLACFVTHLSHAIAALDVMPQPPPPAAIPPQGPDWAGSAC